VIGVWLCATFADINLPAEPLSQRKWFFDPFGWQLVFFTGFALASGWIKAPPVDRRLIALAVVVVVVSIPFAYFRIINQVPEIREWRAQNVIWFDKTNMGILRYIHFLALAYLAVCVVGPKGARLLESPANSVLASVWIGLRSVVLKVGQQSLAVFIFSMFIAIQLGAVFDLVGRSVISMIWVNAIGFGLVALVAYSVAWFKKKPWVAKGAAR
jgi:hypothetical protein